jgi:putative peptidoglycan lipid II flippase
MALAQAWYLRRTLGGIEGWKILSAFIKILVATAALAGVSYGVWYGLDQALGRSLVAQIASLAIGIGAGIAIYAAAVFALRVEEAHQIRRLVAGRFGRRD